MIVTELKFKEGEYLEITSPDKKASVWVAYSYDPMIHGVGLTREEAVERYNQSLASKVNADIK